MRRPVASLPDVVWTTSQDLHTIFVSRNVESIFGYSEAEICDNTASVAKKVVILIDGGFLRVKCRKDGKQYNPEFIESFALGYTIPDEEILRIFYYDCAPFVSTVKLPVSGNPYPFASSDKWLEDLARKDLFAVR